MNPRVVSRLLKGSRSKSDIANFFLDPDQRPDLVLELLLKGRKKKQGGKLPDLSFLWAPGGRVQGSEVSLQVKSRLLRNGRRFNRLFFRQVILLGFFMFLSCAIAPNSRGISAVASDPPLLQLPQDLEVNPDSYVEPTAVAMKTAWYMARGVLSGRPVAEELLKTFGGRLVNGDWAGIVLVDPRLGMKALVREDSADYVAEWIARHNELEEENKTLYNAMVALRKTQDSKKIYLEIDQTNTRLYVKMGTQVLYDFPIVCGKGYSPRETGRVRRFSTPRGILKVISKETNPVWIPPPWHWTERGIPPPPVRRGIPGILGKYRLNLGDGYGIHGTAGGWISPGRYSHGCIRMNARDLAIVFKLCDVGTEVYIY